MLVPPITALSTANNV